MTDEENNIIIMSAAAAKVQTPQWIQATVIISLITFLTTQQSKMWSQFSVRKKHTLH